MNSHAASISAWWRFLPWASIVDALMRVRQGPASISAARRKMLARCSHSRADQAARASSAASMASLTCSALMVVWRGQGALVLGEDLSAANHHGDRDGILVEHALILGELGLALEAAGAVSEDGFIFRIRNLEKGVGHGVSLWPQM